jgi:uncharacterized protein (TIGR02996 family)
MARVTEAELLAAVLAAPDQDAPRLVYADWLIERGDPRGAFISRQIRDRRNAPPPTKEERQAWGGVLATMYPAVLGWMFERGFVNRIHANEWGWLERADEIFAEHPVEELSLTCDDGYAEGLAALAECRHLGRIEELVLNAFEELRGPVLEPLIKARSLAIRTLRISVKIDLAVARSIARWRGLRSLHVDCELDGEVATTIAAGPSLAKVTSLDLSATRTAQDASALVEALVGNEKIAKLEDLDLARNQLDGQSLRRIFQRFSGLDFLTLTDTGLTDAKIAMIAKQPSLATVTLLDVASNQIGDRGAIALASSAHVGAIRELWILNGNRVGAKGEAALRERFGARVS